MEITSTKIEIVDPKHNPYLLAVSSIVLDGEFVVHEIKLIQGKSGKCFISMPGRKRREGCPNCRKMRNELDANYCARCGVELQKEESRYRDADGRSLLYIDICHPLNPDFREYLEKTVMASYEIEKERYFGKGVEKTSDNHYEEN